MLTSLRVYMHALNTHIHYYTSMHWECWHCVCTRLFSLSAFLNQPVNTHVQLPWVIKHLNPPTTVTCRLNSVNALTMAACTEMLTPLRAYMHALNTHMHYYTSMHWECWHCVCTRLFSLSAFLNQPVHTYVQLPWVIKHLNPPTTVTSTATAQRCWFVLCVRAASL